MQSVANKIQSSIERYDPGTVFTIKRFRLPVIHIDAAERELSRLLHKGVIKRYRRGIYYKPATSAFFGEVLPNPVDIAKEIARFNSAKIIPDGPIALNMLGLSTQVPMKHVYINDKLHKTEMVGNIPIIFKRVSPKKLSGAGRKAGLVLSALEYLGKEQAEDKHIQKKIANQLSRVEKEDLIKAVQTHPKWTRNVVDKIVNEVY